MKLHNLGCKRSQVQFSETLWISTSFMLLVCRPQVCWAYLVTEVLGSDAENVQAQGGLLQVGLEALQLQSLLLATIPQLLDQRQLPRPVSLNGTKDSCCLPMDCSNREQID